MPDLFDEFGYIGYPMTITTMIKELKRIIDDYQEKILTNEEFQIIILFYADTSPSKLFIDKKLNGNVKGKIGQLRAKVLETVLEELGFL